MSYEYPVDVTALWSERAPIFKNLGVPTSDVDRLVEVVDDMWADRPGGWCYEWSRLADRYATSGDAWLAVAAYGGARVPCLANDAKATAHRHQIEQYQFAAADFPVTFERRTLTARFRGEIVEVPLHILAEPDATESTPVLVVTGGIDTWKMDLHQMWVAYALNAHVRVVACDIPGTGELTHVPLTADSTAIIDQVVAFAHTLTTGRVGQLGMSFGGYFSAQSGLTGIVDAAVVVGGPVLNAFTADNVDRLIYGMRDIFANALGFTCVPTNEEVADIAKTFQMGDLLDRSTNCPMLVINGDQDAHIPLADTQLFEGRLDTEVEIVAGGTHCAANKLEHVITTNFQWLITALH